jgi:hypothetical protein
LRRELVAGRPVALPDGRSVAPEDVLGPPRRGTKLIHVGDCASTDDLVDVCRQADGLVIEATYLDVEAELAAEFGHLTAIRQPGCRRSRPASAISTSTLPTSRAATMRRTSQGSDRGLSPRQRPPVISSILRSGGAAVSTGPKKLIF